MVIEEATLYQGTMARFVNSSFKTKVYNLAPVFSIQFQNLVTIRSVGNLRNKNESKSEIYIS